MSSSGSRKQKPDVAAADEAAVLEAKRVAPDKHAPE